jgi:hypothetical protein
MASVVVVVDRPSWFRLPPVRRPSSFLPVLFQCRSISVVRTSRYNALTNPPVWSFSLLGTTFLGLSERTERFSIVLLIDSWIFENPNDELSGVMSAIDPRSWLGSNVHHVIGRSHLGRDWVLSRVMFWLMNWDGHSAPPCLSIFPALLVSTSYYDEAPFPPMD